MEFLTKGRYDNIKLQAFKSRLLLIFIQYIANIFIPDHKPQVFHFTSTGQVYGIIDKVIFHIFGGFLRWDAQYFVHISIYGYTYENSVAFFPLFPILIGIISKNIHYFFGFISIEAIVLLLAVIFNVILFIFTSVVLYKLTCLVFNDISLAYKAVLLFCYNPASVFFVAPYSECLYSFLTFHLILKCLTLYNNFGKGSFQFHITNGKVIIETALSAITRSNGTLNIGFLIFTYICLMKKTLPRENVSNIFLHILKYICSIFIVLGISLVFFVMYQLYCYKQFCTDFIMDVPDNVRLYAIHQNYILPGHFSKYNQSWCYNHIPLAYSYVQGHYWNVGFLKYYELKQIPNFILAAPIIIIIWKYCVFHLSKNICKNLSDIFILDKTLSTSKQLKVIIFDPVLNVFVIHVFSLLLFCVLFIHIQVTTRMLCSSSPVLYWYCAHFLNDLPVKETYKSFFFTFKSQSELLTKIYFFSYFVIGTVLFSNFLPWT